MEHPKILLVRCSRLPHFQKALARVREQYPNHEIHVLARRSLVTECSNLAGVDRVFAHPNRPFSLLRTMPCLLPALRLHVYRLVVLPVTGDVPADYVNVELAIAPLRFERVAIATQDGCWFETERRQFLSERLLQDVCLVLSEWIDVPLLFLLLYLAQALRPIRWLKRKMEPRGPNHSAPSKVLFCIPSLGMGGAQRQMIKMVEAASKRHDVSVCVITGHDFFFRHQLDAIGITLHVLNDRSDAYVLSAWRLWQLLRRERIDVLHTWLPMANVIGAIAGSYAGTARVITSERCLTSSKRIWYPQWWFRFADALAARLASVVTANADAVLNDYVRWAWLWRQPRAVVYNGIDGSEFEKLDDEGKERLRGELGLAAGARLVGIFGRLEAEKNHQAFLNAFRIMNRDLSDAQAVIVGGGSLAESLQAAAAEMGISERVRFLGSRRDATSIMQICDVVVLSSTTEGMPNVLLEAQCLGIPVVATDAGGCREVVNHGETGLIVPVGDSSALAHSIQTLLADPAIVARFGASAAHRVRREFALEYAAEAFETLYRYQPVCQSLEL